MKYNKETFEIIFHARGGQGAKTATEILARAAIQEGKFARAFPDFGPERSGAPIRTYLRVSEDEIRTQESIYDPDAAVVMDETIIEHENVIKYLDRNEALIINSKQSPNDIGKKIPHFLGKIYSMDASSLSLQITGKPNPNVVMLGQIAKITELVKLETIIDVTRRIFLEKLGKELTDKNVMAIQQAYDAL